MADLDNTSDDAALPVADSFLPLATATWNSSTALNTTLTVNTTGFSSVFFSWNPTGTVNTGTLNFEISLDNGVTWFLLPAINLNAAASTAVINPIFGVGGQVPTPFQAAIGGATQFRIRLNPVITGTGSGVVQIAVSSLPQSPLSSSIIAVGPQANNAGGPSFELVGVLPALANASFPTWTEGNQVLESVDLSGRQRTLTTLGVTEGKTIVMKTGTLVTTAVTADQVILTRTVTAGKTFFIQYIECIGTQTVPAGGTNILLGVASLELPSGTKVISSRVLGGGSVAPDGFLFTFSEPIFATSGQVVRVVVTPAAATSFTWVANFGGYER